MEYGLVLAGGGVRGAYQIGVWKALKELKIKVSAVSGVSIGAVTVRFSYKAVKQKPKDYGTKLRLTILYCCRKKWRMTKIFLKSKT